MTESEYVEKLVELVGSFWGGENPFFAAADDRDRSAIAAEARDTLVAWRRDGVRNREDFKLLNRMIRGMMERVRSMLDALRESERVSNAVLGGGSGWASASDVVNALSAAAGGERGRAIVAEVRGDALALSNGGAEVTVPVQDGQVDLEKVGSACRRLR
jgi:hypothetical protein